MEKQILRYLKASATPSRRNTNKWYIKSNYLMLGNSVPDIRKVLKKIENNLSHYSHKKTKEIFNKLWHTSETFEVLFLPVLYFSNLKNELNLDDWIILKTWTKKIDNWAHSDIYSGVISCLVEKHPEEMLNEMKQWNKSKNPWERRLSLTSLIYYSRTRKHLLPANKILNLIKNLLKDEDIYVQKAVGWTLRECGNHYKKDTKHFIKKNILNISPIAFTSAVEKWSSDEKIPLKLKRKISRIKNKKE